MNQLDVIIVGAGPAGSALATFLAEGGCRVALLEKGRFPKSKPCGEFMSPEALSILQDLGVLNEIEQSGARKLQGLSVWSQDGSCFRGDYVAACGRVPFRPYGLAVRRMRFDQILFQCAANRSGVFVQERFLFRRLLKERDQIVGIVGRVPGKPELKLYAPWVIGADGVRSRVAQDAGLVAPNTQLQKFAFVGYYEGLSDENRGELHLGPACYAGFAPVDAGLVNVNLIVDRSAICSVQGDPARFFESRLASIPGLANRLSSARRVGIVRGVGPIAWKTRSCVAKGVALIGDAVEFVDPFTGEGIYMALRSAQMAAEEILKSEISGENSMRVLESYRKRRFEEFHAKIAMCWNLQGLIYRPWLMNWAVTRLADRPALVEKILAVSGDYVSPQSLGLFSLLRDIVLPKKLVS